MGTSQSMRIPSLVSDHAWFARTSAIVLCPIRVTCEECSRLQAECPMDFSIARPVYNYYRPITARKGGAQCFSRASNRGCPHKQRRSFSAPPQYLPCQCCSARSCGHRPSVPAHSSNILVQQRNSDSVRRRGGVVELASIRRRRRSDSVP